VKITALNQTFMTQNSKMQPNLIMIKADKSQDKQYEVKLTAVNLDELLNEKINIDLVKIMTFKEVRIFLCIEILK